MLDYCLDDENWDQDAGYRSSAYFTLKDSCWQDEVRSLEMAFGNCQKQAEISKSSLK